jgi:hypothetical protein
LLPRPPRITFYACDEGEESSELTIVTIFRFFFLPGFYSLQQGDLKAYLRAQKGTPAEDGLKRDGVLLRMAQEVAAALTALHHRDLVQL